MDYRRSGISGELPKCSRPAITEHGSVCQRGRNSGPDWDYYEIITSSQWESWWIAGGLDSEPGEPSAPDSRFRSEPYLLKGMAMSQEHCLRTESGIAKTLRFIGEQDGTPEREFKERVIPLLDASGSVERGYLARVAYESASTELVALCLVAHQPTVGLLGLIGTTFASMFGRDQHLDIVFIDSELEPELARVCQPFFRSVA